MIVEAVNNTLTSYIKLCNYIILNSSEPIKVTHLQKSVSIEWRTCDRQMVKQFF